VSHTPARPGSRYHAAFCSAYRFMPRAEQKRLHRTGRGGVEAE